MVEPGTRVKGYPYTFYTITQEARTLFDRNDLFPEKPWQNQYARVQKTGEVRELEAMPRPGIRSWKCLFDPSVSVTFDPDSTEEVLVR